MTPPVALTVDVEDWYEGMAVLGEHVRRPSVTRSGLEHLLELLSDPDVASSRLTLFVVARHAPALRTQLEALAAAGHEIASHGPDHGALPGEVGPLVQWLREGRERIEEVVQRPVIGFRSPRFDIPPKVGLAAFRGAVADAGFRYVSDCDRLGATSPVRELPVLRWRGFPVGGGSYQRLVPGGLLRRCIEAERDPAILYYHSYDFGSELPRLRATRSVMTVTQVARRSSIPPIVASVLRRFGSAACRELIDAV